MAAQDAVAIVVRVADAAAKPHRRRKTERRKNMGSSTGSMFYAFGAFLIIYLVGVSIYQLVLWIKKWRERRKDEE